MPEYRPGLLKGSNKETWQILSTNKAGFPITFTILVLVICNAYIGFLLGIRLVVDACLPLYFCLMYQRQFML